MERLYTKKGDFGNTALFDGRRIGKNDFIFRIANDIDELNGQIGLLIVEERDSIPFLREIQRNLILFSRIIAKSSETIPYDCVEKIETQIDSFQGKGSNFVLPGTTKGNALSYICRSITRRVECNVWGYCEYTPLLKMAVWFNRLSDYFLVLAQYLNGERNEESNLYEKKYDVLAI